MELKVGQEIGKMVKCIVLLAAVGTSLPIAAEKPADDVFLQFDETNTNRTCVMPVDGAPAVGSADCLAQHNFLRQGHRTELRVFHRKFLTDYTLTVDGVTQVDSGPRIRNLNEAENLTIGTASWTAPLS